MCPYVTHMQLPYTKFNTLGLAKELRSEISFVLGLSPSATRNVLENDLRGFIVLNRCHCLIVQIATHRYGQVAALVLSLNICSKHIHNMPKSAKAQAVGHRRLFVLQLLLATSDQRLWVLRSKSGFMVNYHVSSAWSCVAVRMTCSCLAPVPMPGPKYKYFQQ